MWHIQLEIYLPEATQGREVLVPSESRACRADSGKMCREKDTTALEAFSNRKRNQEGQSQEAVFKEDTVVPTVSNAI